VVNEMKDSGLSLRKALEYSGCSNNMYYHQQKPRDVGFDHQSTLSQIRQSVKDHGFAVVTIHAMEFARAMALSITTRLTNSMR
jgi:hypothetical protein